MCASSKSNASLGNTSTLVMESKKSQERDDQLLRLRTALYGTARPDGSARDLKVVAKGVAIPELKVVRGNTAIKLEVAILSRKDFTIAFRFLKHLDQSGEVIIATGWFSKGYRTIEEARRRSHLLSRRRL